MPLPLQQNEHSIQSTAFPSSNSEVAGQSMSIEVVRVINVDAQPQTEQRVSHRACHLNRSKVSNIVFCILMALIMFIIASVVVTFPTNIIFYSIGTIFTLGAFVSFMYMIFSDNQDLSHNQNPPDNQMHVENRNRPPHLLDYLPPSYESLGFAHSVNVLPSRTNNEDEILPTYDEVTANSESTLNNESDDPPPSYESTVSRFGVDLYIPPYNPNRRQQRIQFGSNLENPQLSVPNMDVSEQSSSVQSDQPSESDPEVLFCTQF